MAKRIGWEKLVLVVLGIICLKAFALEEDPFVPMLRKAPPQLLPAAANEHNY